MRKFAVVSLGCDKNRVDSENMISYLMDAGDYDLTFNDDEAEVIIVNTCGFIKSSIQESINTIFEMSLKKENACKFLVVTGCMSQRFMDELANEIKEVDLFIGTMNYHRIKELVDSLYENKNIKTVKNDINDRNFTTKRYLSTPPYYAYLKIAEGCSNRCTYCAIPLIRGNYTSREMGSLIEETKDILSEGLLKELIVVAQDVTRYGIDLYGKHRLVDLIKELDKLGIEWIRLLYCYPELVTEELIDAILESKHVLRYLDIPLQHVSDGVLKRMNRRTNYKQIVSLIEMIRKKDPSFVIRSTFIVGFPGETEDDFNLLKEFLIKYELDRVGFFIFSKEEGTPAYKLKDQIPERIKKRRYKEIYDIQQKIMAKKQQSKVGKVFDVIYEGIDYDREYFFGRTKNDAPNIDAVVYFKSDEPLLIGEIYKVKIETVDGLDLVGGLCYEN